VQPLASEISIKGGTLPRSEGEGGSIATKDSVLRPYKPIHIISPLRLAGKGLGAV